MSVSAPVRLTSPSGLVAQVNANGSIRRMDHADVIVNAFLANELEGGPANLFLRRRVPATGPTSGAISWIPLAGPRSPSEVRLDEHGLEITGDWSGLRFRVSLRLAHGAPAWFWHVELDEHGTARRDGRPRARAGPRARRLRRGAPERVLRQPVRRPHAARASRRAVSCSRRGRTSRSAAGTRGP